MAIDKEKIKAMKSGRELDQLIAENIFHIKVYFQAKGYPLNFYNSQDIPEYSSDIKSAWSILNKLFEEGWIIQKLYRDDGIIGFWECQIGLTEYTRFSNGEKAPEAICKAALLTCR